MSRKANFETAPIVTTDAIDGGAALAASTPVATGPTQVALPRLERYELRRPLGKGGFATVYEAYDPRIKRAVAIKKCSSLDEDNQERFVREAEIVGNLSHPNVVRVFDFGVADGTPFIVQELLSGRDLSDWIDSGLELSTLDRVRILLQIARGVAYAHSRDVIHRDLKPANVRVLEDGSVKLLDFGVAAIQEAPSGLTQAGVTVGTAAYLAPEQINGERPSRATDMFSFGALAYELLSGHRPFAGETLSALLHQIAHRQPEELTARAFPSRLARLVHRCLEKDPARRPESFERVAEDLEEVLRDPRLAPPSAETVPIATHRRQAPPSDRTASARSEAGVSLPLRPREGARLADVTIDARRPPLRDSAARIQVARRPRRARAVVLATVSVLASISAYSYLGGSPPESVAETLAKMTARLPAPARDVLELLRAPNPAPVSVGVLPAAHDPTLEDWPKPPIVPASDPVPDPVTAVIASLMAQRPSTTTASAPPARPRPRPAKTAPATVFLPPSWHPQMMVSVDGGAFHSLDRRRTRELEPGVHKLAFWLNTSSYQARRTLEVDLASAETHTIESPLTPPAALEVAVVPASLDTRVEIDGRALALPLPAPLVLEPGGHRITLQPSPADPLGPLTKNVDLDSATVHRVTFDMRRRRVAVETLSAFVWDGP